MLFPERINFNRGLVDNFFTDVFSNLSVANTMSTDIKEIENGYELAMEVPGFEKEDLKLELKNGYLTVSAEHKNSNESKDEQGKVIRQERYYGSCKRSFYVGEDIEREDVSAKYDKGILKIAIPKKEAKKIEETPMIEIQ